MSDENKEPEQNTQASGCPAERCVMLRKPRCTYNAVCGDILVGSKDCSKLMGECSYQKKVEIQVGKDAFLTKVQLGFLTDIGQYLHEESINEKSRSQALQDYFNLYDSVTGNE